MPELSGIIMEINDLRGFGFASGPETGPCVVFTPESLATRLGLHPHGAYVWTGKAVGETPTAAVGTTALPRKSLMIRVSRQHATFALLFMSFVPCSTFFSFRFG